MKCRDARIEIALGVGGDLSEESAARLDRHVAVCPQCRQHRQELFGTHLVLRAASEAIAPTEPEAGPGEPLARPASPNFDRPGALADESGWRTLWPGISRRLDARDESLRAPRFNGWAPFLAVTAACALVAVLSSREVYTSRPRLAPAMPVGAPVDSFPEGEWWQPQFGPRRPLDDAMPDFGEPSRLEDDADRHREGERPIEEPLRLPIFFETQLRLGR